MSDYEQNKIELCYQNEEDCLDYLQYFKSLEELAKEEEDE